MNVENFAIAIETKTINEKLRTFTRKTRDLHISIILIISIFFVKIFIANDTKRVSYVESMSNEINIILFTNTKKKFLSNQFFHETKK